VEGGGTKSDHGWLWQLWRRWCHYGFCIGVQCAAGIPDWLGQWQQQQGGLGGLPDPSSLDTPLFWSRLRPVLHHEGLAWWRLLQV
jgi:hypothetical protein